MSITVIFFASIREQLECEQLTVEAQQATTVLELKTLLSHRGTQWQKVFLSSTLLSAVNQQMVDESASISSNDTIAFFPPVTGG